MLIRELFREEKETCSCDCGCGKPVCESCGKPHAKKDIKKKIKEFATSGGTNTGMGADVVNPTQAYGHRKRDKNGVPKAPQKKNPDGTAKNALDINNSLMGGSIVKRKK
jgi:hypothetical protein|tara:strand:- start:827 stop:1153 length:327 start_codon:yes stop_codon:yes gene_type:complete